MATRPSMISFPLLLGRTTEQYAAMLQKAESDAQNLMGQVLFDLGVLLDRVPDLGSYLELKEDSYKLVEPADHASEEGENGD